MSRFVVAAPKAERVRRFKVGDSVRMARDDDFPSNVGAIGRVTSFVNNDPDVDYEVRFERNMVAFADKSTLRDRLDGIVQVADFQLQAYERPKQLGQLSLPGIGPGTVHPLTHGSTSLTLRRVGDFVMRTAGVDGANHCGLQANQEMKYEVFIKCRAPVSLDQRGFLFEQREVQQYFDDLGSTGLSCELLTCNSVAGLYALIRKENPLCEVLSIELTLTPKPYLASMICRWELGQG
jgi:hypothetical protein